MFSVDCYPGSFKNMKNRLLFSSALAAFGMVIVSSVTADGDLTLACEGKTQFCLMQGTDPMRCDPVKQTRHMISIESSSIRNLDEYGFLTFEGACEQKDTTIECSEYKESMEGPMSRT